MLALYGDAVEVRGKGQTMSPPAGWTVQCKTEATANEKTVATAWQLTLQRADHTWITKTTQIATGSYSTIWTIDWQSVFRPGTTIPSNHSVCSTVLHLRCICTSLTNDGAASDFLVWLKPWLICEHLRVNYKYFPSMICHIVLSSPYQTTHCSLTTTILRCVAPMWHYLHIHLISSLINTSLKPKISSGLKTTGAVENYFVRMFM